MSTIRDKKRYHLLNDEEPPPKKLLSDGDLLIKELSLKQFDTNVTLQGELLKNQNFVKSTEFVPITSYTTGCSSLEVFQQVNEDVSELEELKSADLVQEEINFYKDSEKGIEYLHSKHKNLSREYINTKLAKVKCKLKEYKYRQFIVKSNDETTDGNRHLKEFAYAIKPNSTETKLLKFAFDNKVQEAKIIHPIDNIKSIEQALFPKVTTGKQNIAKIRKKARKLAAKIAGNTPHNFDDKNDLGQRETQVTVDHKLTRTTKWDLKINGNDIKSFEPKKVFTCLPQNYYTIKDGKIVKLNDKEIEEKNILELNKRLNIEEIKQIPKFKNFDKGSPSKILYLNNLPNNLQIEELKHIFHPYDNGQLEYRLLEKRLRGRAFIYFQDEESATIALNDLLGVLIKDKPLIIEFGKKI